MTERIQRSAARPPGVAMLAVLMACQAALGLGCSGAYRDAAWIRAAWFANDWVTLVVVTPLLVAAHRRARLGSTRAALVVSGCLAYAVYNYAYYMLGAALNAFFAMYVATLLVAGTRLVQTVRRMDVDDVGASVVARAPARLAGGYFVSVGALLAGAWLSMWAAFAFFGRPTPVEPDAFRLVAALDLTMVVPILVVGGALLWQRRPWGFLLASIAGVQSALYLLVLATGSIVAVGRGLAPAPGEAPLWGTLALLSAGVTARLLASVSARDRAAPT